MKKVVFIVFLPVFILSYTGLGGGRGHLFVQDALTQGPGYLTLSFHNIYRNEKKMPGDSLFHFSDLLLELTYSPIDYLEISGYGGGIFKDYFYAKGVSPQIRHLSTRNDWQVKGKISIPKILVFKPAFIVSYNWPRDTIYEENGCLKRKGMEWIGAVNLKFSDLFAPLPNILFNYGKYKDIIAGRDTSHTFFGSGFELSSRRLLFFVEYYYTAGRKTLTPGLKFISSFLTLDLGLSFRFINTTTKNQFHFGLTYLTPFFRPLPIPVGKIIGKVYDAKTQQPIPAQISFPENPKLKPLTNDPTTGIFSAEKIPEGTVLVEVKSEGYYTDYVPVIVKRDQVINQDFPLKPLKVTGVLAGRIYEANTGKPLSAKISFPNTNFAPVFSDSLTGSFRIDDVPVGVVSLEVEREGYFKNATTVMVKEREVTNIEMPLNPSTFLSIVTGKVSDRKTGEGLRAEITFEGANIPPLRTDSLTGIYRAELPVGSYTAIVKAEGYITQSSPLVVEKDKITEKNFSLVSVGMTITLRGVYFEFNKATIKPESYRVLDEAASILKENSKILVEIQGHTDNIGADAYNQKLSERRAYAVVNYFVTQHGIDPRRLKAKGFGETKPIAPNTTEEGRALNRRVEFVVLGEEK